MKEEIAAAVFFLARLVKRYGGLQRDGRERFAAALTAALFEKYKNHWHPSAPTKGQAYRCLRMNQVLPEDPVLQQACERSAVRYGDLGLPGELTVWVDPGRVSCRYGEHGTPFCVSTVDGCRRGDGEFSRRIYDAVERASLDVPSESSSEDEDEEGDDDNNDDDQGGGGGGGGLACPAAAKTIPTVINPNSVYRFSEFSSGAPQTWLRDRWKSFPGDGFPPHPAPLPGAAAAAAAGHFPPSQKAFKSYRASFTFTGPRVDKYHWVSKSRS